MKKIIFFTLLSLFTLATGLFVERYIDCSPELLVNSDFHKGFDGWVTHGVSKPVVLEGGHVLITGGGAGRTASISQMIEEPSQYQMLRLSGVLACEGILVGKKPWNLGRLLLTSHRADGKWIAGSHVAGQVEGTQGQQKFSGIFFPVKEADHLKVVLQVSQAVGLLYGWNLSLREVQQVWWYVYLRYFCLTLWCIFFLFFLFLPYLQDKNIVRFSRIALPIFMAVILIGTSSPGSLKSKLNTTIDLQIQKVEKFLKTNTVMKQMIEQELVQKIRRVIPNKSKVAHFVLFAGLTFGIVFVQKAFLLCSVLDLVMLAVGSELIQFYVEGRSPYLSDLSLDLFGAGVGFLLVYVLFLSKKKEWYATGRC